MKKPCELFASLEKPTVRKKIDATLDVFPNPQADKPIFTASLNGNWNYKLISALAVISSVVLFIWFIRKLCKLF